MLILSLLMVHFKTSIRLEDFWPDKFRMKIFKIIWGLGHLYLGTVFTALFGGDYKASLIAFSFLSVFGAGLISAVIGYAVFGKKETAVSLSNMLLLLLLVQPVFFKNALIGTEDIYNALFYAVSGGNSARYVRGLILPIICFVIMGGYRIGIRIIKRQKEVMFAIGVGLAAGIAFPWSNDYGISCWVCLAIMTVVIVLSRTRKFFVAVGCGVIELLASVFGIVLTVLLVTKGNLLPWINATFGTGGFQSWYYNGIKSYYLYDVDFSFLMCIQALLSITYLFLLYRNRGSRYALRRYGILAFVNMVCFCAVNEYKLLSGSDMREVALATLFFTVIYEIGCFALKVLPKVREYKTGFYVAVCLLCGAWLVSTVKDELIYYKETVKSGTYVDALGGTMTALGGDLLTTAEFLGEEEFWATYASAQEVVCDEFQPSGTDYIIHVLGDEQREKYLEAFETEDFKFAATIKETYNVWEYWIQRANWFFYRELYENWHPVYANSYEMYWERNEEGESNALGIGCQLSVQKVDEATQRVIIKTEENINGVADVYVKYAVEKTDSLSSKFVFMTLLKVKNTGKIFADNPEVVRENYDYNNLRAKGAEYIPVTIVDGYGEITLSGQPHKNVKLVIDEVKCENIFGVTYDYIEVNKIISEESISIIAVNNGKNLQVLKNAKAIVIDNEPYEIEEVNATDVIQIVLKKSESNKNISMDSLKNGNVLKVMKHDF